MEVCEIRKIGLDSETQYKSGRRTHAILLSREGAAPDQAGLDTPTKQAIYASVKSGGEG
jgi:hypothetical protein